MHGIWAEEQRQFIYIIIGVQDQLVDALSLLHERAEQDDPNSLFSLVNDLSKVLCKKISGENLWSLLLHLLDGLVDHQGHSSSGACVVLNQIVKLRGKSLDDQVRSFTYTRSKFEGIMFVGSQFIGWYTRKAGGDH